MTLLKGLPMTYNRDLQEDKEPLFDCVDTLKECLAIFTEMIKHTKFNKEKMHAAAQDGFSTATDVAEYLVKKGVPFRKSHEIVGKIIAYCIKNKKELAELELEDYKKYYSGFTSDIRDVIKLGNVVNSRQHLGGTARAAVLKRIKEIEKNSGKI
jgi:argininosuccinate lyase